MNQPVSINPANARSAPLPGAAADAAQRPSGAATKSFSSVLDRTLSSPRARALARLRNPQERPAGGGDAGDARDARIEAKPIKEEQEKPREESPDNLAGAVAVVGASAPDVELDRSQGWQWLRPPSHPAGDGAGALPAADLAPTPGPVASPLLAVPDVAVPAGTKVPGALESVANPEAASVETLEAKAAAAGTNPEFVAAGQLITDDSRPSGTTELVALVSPRGISPPELSSGPLTPIPRGESQSEPASPPQPDLHEATPGSSTTVGLPGGLLPEGSSQLAEDSGPPLEGGTLSSALHPRTITRGTAVAKMGEQMKNTMQQEEISDSAGQILPGTKIVQPRPARAGLLSEALVVAASAKDTGAAARAELLLPSDGLTGRLTPVERMTEVISREVRMFQRTADETMEVVLTPDQRTQISLRLQWREGKVEIHARLQQGDYYALHTQWPQLQTALAQQGVRLSPLTQPAHTGYTEFFSATGFSQSQNGGQRQPGPKVAFDELPSVAAMPPAGKTPPRTARARRMLESWA